MNTARTFSILLAALALVSGTPLLVVAAQEPVQETRNLPDRVEATHHQLGLQF